MTGIPRPTRTHPLMILAMDHRDSFGKLFGVTDKPDSDQMARMRRAKGLIYDGLRAAAAEAGDGEPGVLVDEDLGAQVLRRARADAITLAMPVERSGQKQFALEFGTDTPEHVSTFDPDYVKVLVRMNPADHAVDISDQLAALAQLSRWLQTESRPLLYELLVPATDGQQRQAGGAEAFDRDVRPELVCDVIRANQLAGVEPALWKIEGLETTEAAQAVVAAAHADGRDADCILLGRDAPADRLDHWLQVAAAVDGFVGFAIGRSIWEQPVQQHVQDADDSRLVQDVRANYLHFARTYLDARGSSP